MRTIRVGDFGEDAADVQQRLVAAGESIDAGELGGRYGASTEAATRALQQRGGLLVGGIVGAETWGELVEAGFALGDRTLYLRHPHLRGDDVRSLQRKLSSLGFDTRREDGIFGPRCDLAVRELQRNVGREADGIVGIDTILALERLRPQQNSAPAGQRLAELVQEELTTRVGLMDGRVHPMAFTILRETQMRAVQVEPCFITNAKEEQLLGEGPFRFQVAAAIVEGLERF